MPDINDNRRNETPLARVRFVVGQIILFVFGIPFVVAGIFMLSHARKKDNATLLAISSLIFCAFGLWTMFKAVTAGRRKKQAEAKLLKQTAGGEKPWLVRADWAAGKIKSSAMAQTKMHLIVGLAFCGIGAMYVFAALPKELHNGNHLALIVLLFPAIGIWLLGYSFVKWRSRRRFGDCFFELAQIPAPLGGTLEGMIQTGARLKLEHGLHLKLSCIRRTVSGSGKNRSVTENILWQDEKIFKAEADLPEPEPGHGGIPVFFKLPADQPECYARGSESVFWRLETKSKMRGPDFSVVFDVPVFKVAGAIAENANEPDPTAALQEPIEDIRRDEHSKIQVTDGPNGREFYFPAARNISAAILTTILFLALSGGLYAMIVNHFGVFFEMILGLFAVIFGCLTFSVWFKSSRIVIDSAGVTVVNHWLFLSRKRRFDAGEVVRIKTEVGMANGSQTLQNLKLITKSSESTLASGIASTPEAGWLAAEMTKALGRRA